jgi:hypothetical protein
MQIFWHFLARYFLFGLIYKKKWVIFSPNFLVTLGSKMNLFFDNRVGNQERIFLYSHHGETHAKLASFRNAKKYFLFFKPPSLE